MFGFSAGEVVVLGAIALIVFLPRNLPGMLRALGQLIARLRR